MKLSKAQETLLREVVSGRRSFCVDTYKPALILRKAGYIICTPRAFGFSIEATELGNRWVQENAK